MTVVAPRLPSMVPMRPCLPLNSMRSISASRMSGSGKVGSASTAPVDRYLPTTAPGARPPSVFLADGTAIFDLFDVGFTLLRFADVDVAPMVAAAEVCRVPLTVVDIRDRLAHELYERDLVLIRPDQHVAWRGNGMPADPAAVLDRVRGVSPARPADLASAPGTPGDGARGGAR